MNTLGIVAFAVALLLSVVIHEAGHFVSAKAFGMKATQFFVGFGPTLFSRRKGETEYGVKAIPAGGFVKIVGMTPLEEVAEADQRRAFFRQPTPQRVIVLAAGSTMHFVIAILLGLGVAFFTPTAKPGEVVGAVEQCVQVDDTEGVTTPAATAAAAQGQCEKGYVISPALLAGLQPGDVITAIDGHVLTTSDDLAATIRKASSPEVTLGIVRGGRPLTISADLAPVLRDLDTGGAGSQHAFALGVAFNQDPPGYLSPTYSSGLHQAGQYLGFNDQSVLFGFFTAIKKLPQETSQLFNPQRADDSGGAQLQSVVGIAEVSGDIFAAKQVPASVQIGDFLLIVAAVNASVGILNLLPLLPFDGGHIAVTLAERVTRRRRRVADAGRRITDFYQRAAPAMYAASLVIIVFSIVVLVADVKNPAT